MGEVGAGSGAMTSGSGLLAALGYCSLMHLVSSILLLLLILLIHGERDREEREQGSSFNHNKKRSNKKSRKKKNWSWSHGILIKSNYRNLMQY